MAYKKVDDNHKQIVAGLRKIGCFVQSLASLGKGCPDLLVGYRGKWYVIELKDGAKPQCKQKLTPAEIDWMINVQNRAPVHVANCLLECINIVKQSW